jgi:hypothetical protein
MYVFMYVCTDMYIYIYIHIFVCIYTSIYITCIYLYIYINMYTYWCFIEETVIIYKYVSIYIYVYTCIYIYIHMYIYMYIGVSFKKQLSGSVEGKNEIQILFESDWQSFLKSLADGVVGRKQLDIYLSIERTILPPEPTSTRLPPPPSLFPLPPNLATPTPDPSTIHSLDMINSDLILASILAVIFDFFVPPLGTMSKIHILNACASFLRSFRSIQSWDSFCDRLLILCIPDCSLLNNKRIQSLKYTKQFHNAWKEFSMYDFYKNPARFLLFRWCDTLLSFYEK